MAIANVNNEYLCLSKWSPDPVKLSIFQQFYYFPTFAYSTFSIAIKVDQGKLSIWSIRFFENFILWESEKQTNLVFK